MKIRRNKNTRREWLFLNYSKCSNTFKSKSQMKKQKGKENRKKEETFAENQGIREKPRSQNAQKQMQNK